MLGGWADISSLKIYITKVKAYFPFRYSLILVTLYFGPIYRIGDLPIIIIIIIIIIITLHST
jgi:hypothetical protein